MKLLVSMASVLLFVGGLAGSSPASETSPSTTSPKSIAVLLLVVAAGSGSTAALNAKP